MRVRRVADRLLPDLGVEQVALDLQHHQRLGHIGVVPVRTAGTWSWYAAWMKPSCSRVRPYVDVVYVPVSCACFQSGRVATW